MEHINDEIQRRTACVSVPHEASRWKVGDATEQNGHFNAEFAKAKAYLIAVKHSIPFNVKLTPKDTMLPIDRSWGVSFGNVETNKAAIANRR